MTWNPEDIEKVRQLWERGVTAREIALRVRKSRNAVIGLAFRRKWPHGGAEPARGPTTPPKSVPKIVTFPVGEKTPGQCAMLGCRAPRQPGREMCAEHNTERFMIERRMRAAWK